MNRLIVPLATALVVAVVLGGVALNVRRAADTGPAASAAIATPSSVSSAAPSASNFPAFVSHVDNLSKTWTSPLYGYSVRIDPTWTVTSATVSIDNPKSTDATALDSFAVTGTDTTINGAATALGKSTFDAWLTSHHADVAKAVPAGCDGGDPSTWPTVAVGGQLGYLDQLCNAAEVSVHVGDRVYTFGWGSSTFNAGQHLEMKQFETVLENVTFPQAAASASPAH